MLGCFMSVCFVALEPSCWTSAPLLIVYAYLRISDFTNWNNHYYLNILELSLFTITDFEYSPRGLNDDVSRVTELSRRGPEMMDTAESLLMTSEEQTGFDASHGLSGEPESLLSSSDHDKELRRFLVHTVPSWFYFAFRFLICWTYFMAGMSKISEAWLSGYITETMLHNWDFPLVHMLVPRHMTLLQLAELLAWGGLLLDLIGGPLLLTAVTLGKSVATYVCLGVFIPFHVTNLLWLFESIQFFPLNMLATTLLFLPYKTRDGRGKTTSTGKALLVFLIIFGQAAFSLRRFFLFGNVSVSEINEITEVTALHHEFSWRMKSKAIRDSIPHPLLKDKQLKLGYFVAAKWETGTRSVLNTYEMMPRGTTPHRNLIVQFARRKMTQGGSTSKTAYQLSSNHWLAVCGRPFQLVVDSRFDILDSQEPSWPPPLMPFDLPERWRSLLEEDLQSWAPYNNEYFVISRDQGVVANPLLHLSDEVQPRTLRCLMDARLTVLLRGIGPVNCTGPDGTVELKTGKRWELFGHGIWSLVWLIEWVDPHAAIKFSG